MSIVSKLTAKNQTTIPKVIVELLRIRPSSLLVYEVESDGRVLLTAKSATFAELAGSFAGKKRKVPATQEDMDAAVRAGAARRLRRSRR
jgi:bifunctional DNA-binding transcriptional regulator/antitoxin component of YhaV-PrlF toxin-antitoxin module